MRYIADMNDPPEERPRRKNNGCRLDVRSVGQNYAGNDFAGHHEVGNLSFNDVEVRLRVDFAEHLCPVDFPISLRTGALNGGAFPTV